MNSVQTQELVVLLDDAGRSIGAAPKSEVHHGATPLHLAFSCYLFDDTGRVLLTRRALAKRAFPGIWTNSFCGHPGPDESIPGAVTRRAHEELGVDIAELRCVLPDFRYRAVDAGGVLENEICPVFTARAVGPVAVDPDETWIPRGWSGNSCVRLCSCRGRSAPGPSRRFRCSTMRASDAEFRTSARRDARHRPDRRATVGSPRSPSVI